MIEVGISKDSTNFVVALALFFKVAFDCLPLVRQIVRGVVSHLYHGQCKFNYHQNATSPFCILFPS